MDQTQAPSPILGLNGRMDTMQAAILLAILEVFPVEVIQRQEIGERYNTRLNNLNGIEIPSTAENNTSVFAQYTILCNNRESIQNKLLENDVPSVSYYSIPLHLQPVFENLGHKEGDFPEAEKVANQCLSLPMSPSTENDQIKVIDSIQGAWII